ncbi:MAG: hypothetical protein E7I42_27895, partial [Pluralibacter gergoviae]|nr:hypothetical protein [Pluralibacter gergoviae]
MITISGAIIGGCIAGRFALRATEQAHENQKVVAKENEEIIIRSLMQAIHDELEAVFERYNETMGSRVESLGKG